MQHHSSEWLCDGRIQEGSISLMYCEAFACMAIADSPTLVSSGLLLVPFALIPFLLS